MSAIKTAPTTGRQVISTYKVNLTYYQNIINADAEMEEYPVSEPVEIKMLCRSNRAHTQFAMKLFNVIGTTDMEVVSPLAEEFAQIAIVDESVRKAVSADTMACFDLYYSEAVQKDIERFFEGWGVIKRIVNKATE